jgi:gliding motility-associated-like protein
LDDSTSASVAAHPVANTTYTIIATDAKGCKDTATAIVSVNPSPVLYQGGNVVVCQNNPAIQLYASGKHYRTVTWTGGAGVFSNRNGLITQYTPSAAEVSNGGEINVTITATPIFASCTPVSKTININILTTPKVEAGPNAILCANAQVVLSGISSTGKGSWSTNRGGTFADTTTVLSNIYIPSKAELLAGTTKLYLTSTANGVCRAVKDSIAFSFLPIPDTVANDHFEFCNYDGKKIQLDAGAGSASYLWSTKATSQKIIVEDAGIYTVTKFHRNSCFIVDTIVVKDNCGPKIFIPDAFTPGSGDEDNFMKIYGRNIKNFELIIFNRWGEIIFYTTDKDKPWDGKYRGEYVDPSVYPWIANYEGTTDGYRDKYKIRGSVYVIRNKE